MDLHGTQHVQPRPELPVVIGKCLFQDTVDGELSRMRKPSFVIHGTFRSCFLKRLKQPRPMVYSK